MVVIQIEQKLKTKIIMKMKILYMETKVYNCIIVLPLEEEEYHLNITTFIQCSVMSLC